MSLDFQVVVDASEPHSLAAWWARALGWEVEPSDADFIQKMISAGMATEADAMIFDGSLVWRAGAAIRYPGETGRGPHPRVLFQHVPEPKAVKNRLHLDLNVGQELVQETADELVANGATFLHRGEQGPGWWLTLADPEGNEFCVH